MLLPAKLHIQCGAAQRLDKSAFFELTFKKMEFVKSPLL